MRLNLLLIVAASLLIPVAGVMAQTIEVTRGGPEPRQSEVFVGQPLRIAPMEIGRSRPQYVSIPSRQTSQLLIEPAPGTATAAQQTATIQPVSIHVQDMADPTPQLRAQPAIAHMPNMTGTNTTAPYIVVVR